MIKTTQENKLDEKESVHGPRSVWKVDTFMDQKKKEKKKSQKKQVGKVESIKDRIFVLQPDKKRTRRLGPTTTFIVMT